MIKRAIRAYQRWQYRRTPRPAFIPTVTPVERTWSATDERLERDLYLASPAAFWLRPDRHEYKIPCWQIEGIWEAPRPMINKHYLAMQASAYSAMAHIQAQQNTSMLSGLAGLGQYHHPNSLGTGLANSLGRFL